MKKLKTILNCKCFLFLIIFITILYMLITFIFFDKKSKYNGNEKKFVCVIENINILETKLSLDLECKEKVKGTYYFKDDTEKESFAKKYKIGSVIEINGYLNLIENLKAPNVFDYKMYAKAKGMFYHIKLESFKYLSENNYYVYKLKNIILEKTKSYKSNSYLKYFFLKDKSSIDESALYRYKSLGIMQVLSLSSSFFMLYISKILKKNSVLKDVSVLIILYVMFKVTESISFQRSLIYSIILIINRNLKLKIPIYKVIIYMTISLLIVNPYNVFLSSFYYCTIISSFIIILRKKIYKKRNLLSRSLYISFISFLVSIPLNIYFQFELNILSPVYNAFLYPLFTYIIMPVSILSIFIPQLDLVVFALLKLFESLSIILLKIPTNFIFIKPSILIAFLYYLLIVFSLKNKNNLIIFILFLILHNNLNRIFPSTYVLVLDVGQADSILIHHNNKNILIDTGGSINGSKLYSANNFLISLFKSLGISKIDAIILSHGDYDHMGEAINLVNNFKVEKVIFNCGEFNDLEKELIKVLEKKKIKYYSCIKELNIDKNKLYFLQTKEYDNENDNSNVIYTELDGYKFMLMGDAGIEKEKDILEKYNLSNIDVLKVGHHGSGTSSSKEFIKEIKPKYGVISVGKSNRYGHPNKEVLENLENSKIYRTDQDGSIMFKIKNNKLKIETCSS